MMSAVYTNDMDPILLARMAAGDEAAFNELYARYAPALLRDAMRVLRSREDAEDVLQEFFSGFWLRRATLHIEGNLAAYLHTSIRYQAIHFMEKNMRKGGFLQSLTDFAEMYQYISPDRQMESRELQSRIDALTAKLPEKMREVFRLSRQEQLTHREIATRLHLSEETVKKQIYNALKILRQQLSDHPAMGVLIAMLYLGGQ